MRVLATVFFTEKNVLILPGVVCPHSVIIALVTMDFEPLGSPEPPGISRGPGGFKYYSNFRRTLVSLEGVV